MQSFSPEFFGLSDGSFFAVSLVAPATIGLMLILGARQLLRAKWRGYWDVV